MTHNFTHPSSKTLCSAGRTQLAGGTEMIYCCQYFVLPLRFVLQLPTELSPSLHCLLTLLEIILKLKDIEERGKLAIIKRHELSKAQWARIKDLLPPEKKPHWGLTGKSNREMLNVIRYLLNAVVLWQDLPEQFGPWQSIYSRYRVSTPAGVWERTNSPWPDGWDNADAW